MPNKLSSKQLTAENLELRARLEKAEATLSEVLSGEADAMFISGVGGEQLFTLKGTDQSYRTLIENMSEGALTLTPEGLILYANRRFAEMLRTPLEKIIGSDIHHWCTPESRQVIQALLQKETIDNYHEELNLAAADGTPVPVYLSVSRLALDEIDSVCMVATDLTEQKHTEAFLAAEKLSNAILDQAADAIVICDKNGRIMRASKQAQAFCGKSPLGKKFDDAFPLRHLDGTAFSFVDPIDTVHNQSVEAVLNSNGRECHLLMSVGHLKSAQDELLGSVMTLTDITERKTAELALQKNQKQLSEALTIAKIGYWEYDYPTDEFIFNDQYYLLHKMTAEEAGGYRMSSADFASRYVYPEDAPVVAEQVRLAFKSRDPDYFSRIETRILSGAGEIIWVDARFRIEQDLQGNTIRMFGVGQDITESKQAEEHLKLFRTLLDNSSDAIEVLDPVTSRFLDVNETQCRELGYSREELLSMSIPDIDPYIDTKHRMKIETQIEQTGMARFESIHRRKDGSTFPVEVSSKLVELDKTYALNIVRDISERKQTELALRTSEVRFQTIFEQAPLGIALIDSLNGRIFNVNPRFAEIAGRSMEEMKTIDWLQITHPDDVQTDLDNMVLLNSGKISSFHMEKRYLHPDGTAVWINMTISPLKVEDKTQPHHLCMIKDITERKKSEASIKYLNRVLSMLSGINTLIVHVNDREELFREACNIAVRAGGFRMAMIVIVDRSTMLPVSIISAGKDDDLLAAIKDVMSSKDGMQTTMVAQVIREKKAVISNDTQSDPRLLFGKQYAEAGVRSMTILPLIISDEAVGTLVFYANEIEFFQKDETKLLTELANDIAYAIDHIDKLERLNYLGFYDVLTGLANRNLFLDRLTQYIQSANSGKHKLAIGLIDLERFKNINDSLGRPAGDSLLKQVAVCLTQVAGDANLLARIDADHFAFVMPEVKSDGNMVKLIEKLMATFLEHSFDLNDAMYRIGIKVGLALFPDDGDDADTLFRNAEAALKKAKSSGDRFLFYTQKMSATVTDKLKLENQLREAIDNEEFVLYYQPKVNLVSGKVTSAEALIRWNNPRTGLVPPGMFIPILEETGLIYEVGRWALHQAMSDYLHWRAAGLATVRIAVNVSPLQLRNTNFMDEIKQVTSLNEHAAEGLELEITESLIMEDVQYSINTLKSIRAMGITFAIDDFGTGFSSLSYLAKLPIDTLKIDRAFVIEMDKPEGLALVSTIIILAHALNLKVVAEGVETDKQSRQLLSLNCDEMQGFLFSKPVPAEIFEAKFLAPLTPNDKQ